MNEPRPPAEAKRRFHAAAAVALLHLFLLIPVTLYLGNAEQIGTPLSGILLRTMLVALVAWLPLVLLGAALSAQRRRRVTAVLSALGLLVWLQTTLLRWDYGLLDGSTIDWGRYPWQGWVDGALWLGLLTAAVIGGRRWQRSLFRAAILTLVVHAAAAGFGLAGHWRAARDVVAIGAPAASIEEALSFSTGRNVLHILLDGFQSDILEQLIAIDPDRYRGQLAGFTYYRENLGVFPYTQFSIPALFAGRLYRNRTEKDTFLDQTLAGRTILNTAYDRGFEVDLLIGNVYFAKRFANSRHTNLLLIDAVHEGDPAAIDSARLLDLSLFRAAPHFIKRRVYNDQEWLLSKAFSDELSRFFYFVHTRFLERWTREMTADRPTPVYKYLHVMNTHRPMVVNPDCSFAGQTLPDRREILLAQSRCTLETVFGLFDRMRELGVYDDALIVLHGDHGGFVPNLRRGPPIRYPDGRIARGTVVTLASPLLLIKPPGATTGLQVSDALVSLADLPDTISDLLAWGESFGHRSVLDVAEGEARERRFYVYDWRPGEWDRRYTSPIQEFIIDGSHYEVEWRPGELFPPPAAP